ncbi:SAM-dependent methyltransferase [Burkholderia gladioli]|uniref:SAM-dependent methyltransferase n=1 Tax=Burkholderia gladioli TaxID=28095 RepID=A0A2A7SB58_BURGA|nr:class I SAM-dependent methyltransferase [Burkholderia gladioli]PEH40470.1 SAM-dependent methyltransferase [Burkholderia gladioli]
MSKVSALGQYPTPVWVAEALVERHFSRLDQHDLVIEPACGPGAFLGAIPVEVPALGVEIDAQVADIARATTGREVLTGDFRSVQLDCTPTVIIGNPPFDLRVIDTFLSRSWRMLPEGGRVGFILPAYAFQTAARVASYADQWSLMQEMIPRNIYPGLSLPLVFAIFSKDFRRTLIGFALYREAADVQQLPTPFRAVLGAGSGPIWVRVVEAVLEGLGGEASLAEIYAALEDARPTRTRFWREQIRKVVRASSKFECVSSGRYALRDTASRKARRLPIQQSLPI